MRAHYKKKKTNKRCIYSLNILCEKLFVTDQPKEEKGDKKVIGSENMENTIM